MNCPRGNLYYCFLGHTNSPDSAFRTSTQKLLPIDLTVKQHLQFVGNETFSKLDGFTNNIYNLLGTKRSPSESTLPQRQNTQGTHHLQQSPTESRVTERQNENDVIVPNLEGQTYSCPTKGKLNLRCSLTVLSVSIFVIF